LAQRPLVRRESLPQERDPAHDLPGGAEAALEGAGVGEGLAERSSLVREAFDRLDLVGPGGQD
jgi:hypothetical protein